MYETIQILSAATDILELLRCRYETEAYGDVYPCHPDHLIKPIAGVENAALYKPVSILNKVVSYDIYTLDVLRVLLLYPLALKAMCNYTEFDGKNTFDMIKEHKYYGYIKYNYPGLS